MWTKNWPILERKCEMPEGPTEETDKEDRPSIYYVFRNWL